MKNNKCHIEQENSINITNIQMKNNQIKQNLDPIPALKIVVWCLKYKDEDEDQFNNTIKQLSNAFALLK